MDFEQNIQHRAPLRHRFLDQNRQRLYDEMNPVGSEDGSAFIPNQEEADLLNNRQDIAEEFHVKPIPTNFSPFIAHFANKDFNKLRAQMDAQKSRVNTGQINQSGSTYKRPVDYSNLSTAVRDLGSVTVNYGGSTRYENFHPAIDIANKIGTPLPAFTDGTITEVITGKKQGDPGYGNYVIVTDPQGNQHRYSHLHQSYVRVGDKVQKGQGLGTMGNTGQTYSVSGGSGSHLDYRIKDRYGKYINPTIFLK